MYGKEVESPLNVIGTVLLVGGGCLAAAHFGPYGRRYAFVLYLALALLAAGSGLILSTGFSRCAWSLAVMFFAGFIYTSAAHVRARTREAETLHAQRLARLAAESAELPGNSSNP